MKFFPWRSDDEVKFDDDDVNESIIDALDRKPVPYGGDWQETRMIEPGTVPMAFVPRPPNPPSRHARPELHLTPPQGIATPPRSRPSRARALKAAIASLPVFRDTVRANGLRGFRLLPRPRMTCSEAIVAIGVYTEKTHRMICQQTEAAKGELWERARDFDEQELKLRRPLNMQQGM